MLKHTLLAASLLLCSLGAASPAAAQDVFQTGVGEREYNYFQAVYLFDQTVEIPVLFNLYVSVHPNIALLAQYANLTVDTPYLDTDGIERSIKAEAQSFKAGIGFHTSSQRWDNIDWLMALQYLRTNSTYSGPEITTTTRISDKATTEFGLRASVTPKLEAEAVAVFSYSDKNFQKPDLDLTSVYRVLPHFDVALGVRNATQAATYNIGFRYSW